jgi:hypothetical protein
MPASMAVPVRLEAYFARKAAELAQARLAPASLGRRIAVLLHIAYAAGISSVREPEELEGPGARAAPAPAKPG